MVLWRWLQMRVKILFSKQDTALVQLHSPEAAQMACRCLRGIALFGSPLRVSLSRNHTVAPPKVGTAPNAPPTPIAARPGAHNWATHVVHAATLHQPNDQLTKDFTFSKNHRFKSPLSKHLKHRCPPSAVLHLANLPQLPSTEADLRAAFGRHGAHRWRHRGIAPRASRVAVPCIGTHR